MSKRRLVDTNVIVRHLVQDNERQAAEAGRLFSACDRGDAILLVLPAVLAECVFVLESFYNHARADIARVLIDLLRSPGVEIPDRAVHLDALERYRESTVHFVDCAIAATAAELHVSVATFDGDFKRFADVRVDLG